jgi:predicted TIM-barrel fold metal-dependent hydrolase
MNVRQRSLTTSSVDKGVRMEEKDILFISVDDHLVEPANLWTSRLPKEYVDRGPRLLSMDYGDAWAFEDRVDPWIATICSIGTKSTELEYYGRYSDLHPGCVDPAARVADMDRIGMLASLNFPTMPGFSGTVLSTAKDKTLGLLSIQAFNDYVLDEWCGYAPGRLIPAVLLPLWDVELAVQELHRTVAKGAKAVMFSESPPRQGFPAVYDPNGYWDNLFAALSEANIPLCLHIGSSSAMPHFIPDVTPKIVQLGSFFINSQVCLMEWMLSDLFERFPNLKIVMSEAGIGWMPSLIERCDRAWEKYRFYTGSKLPNPPSSYFADHVFGCFMEDLVGMKLLDDVGVDNVMVEVDYPHVDGSYPHTQKVLAEHFVDVSDDDARKMLSGNAERVFNFTPSRIGQR